MKKQKTPRVRWVPVLFELHRGRKVLGWVDACHWSVADIVFNQSYGGLASTPAAARKALVKRLRELGRLP